MLLFLCGDTEGQAGPTEGGSSHHHLLLLETEARTARGVTETPHSWGKAQEGARLTPTPPNPPAQPTTLIPLTARAAAELFQEKHLKNLLLCNVCLLWGVCRPSAKEIRWFQGNSWHRELPGDAQWHHPGPAPPPRGLSRTLRAMICSQICCCSAPDMFALNLFKAKMQEGKTLVKALRHRCCRGG